LICILITWSWINHFGDLSIAINQLSFQANELQDIIISIITSYLGSDILYTSNLFYHFYYIYYLVPPLACGLVALVTGFTAAKRTRRLGPAIIANLLAVLTSSGVMLLACFISVAFTPQYEWPFQHPLRFDASGAPVRDMLGLYIQSIPSILLYLAVIGFPAIGLSLLFAWLGGLSGRWRIAD
jgi:hypothetical protein